jgi:hypothetical protein
MLLAGILAMLLARILAMFLEAVLHIVVSSMPPVYPILHIVVVSSMQQHDLVDLGVPVLLTVLVLVVLNPN